MSTWTAPIFIGLGSNLCDPPSQIEAATKLLHAPDEGLVCERRSSLYWNAAMYDASQPDFVNCVCRCSSRLSPLSLLARLQAIERALGRKKTTRFGPRRIDLDILYYADRIVRSPRLLVPHPRLRERPFVLVPLSELAPDFPDPETSERVQTLLRDLPKETRRNFPCRSL